MLAKFENGYFLEVLHNKKVNEYEYTIYDEDLCYEDSGWTEYRSIEMYYPMNEIDYILEFCEPDGIEGKYEILKQETMKKYEKFIAEDPNGKWILETQGTDDEDIRYYKTEEAARIIMQNEAEKSKRKYCNIDIEDYYCNIDADGYFQSWNIYEREKFRSKKKKLINEIELELVRINRGITQYAYELQDTFVIRRHVEEAELLINQLKEMM